MLSCLAIHLRQIVHRSSVSGEFERALISWGRLNHFPRTLAMLRLVLQGSGVQIAWRLGKRSAVLGIATVPVAPFGVSPNGVAREEYREVTLARAPRCFRRDAENGGRDARDPIPVLTLCDVTARV